MEEKLSGIVLSGVSFGENDKILTIFTLEQGTVSAKIKGVKKAGAKLKFAAEPFCFAEFIFSKNGNMRTVINASLIDSFYPIREDLIKYFSAGTIVEYIKKFLKENIVSNEMFVLAVNSLKELAYGKKSSYDILANFLMEGLSLSGYALNLNGCYKCGVIPKDKIYFDSSIGAFICSDCFSGEGREINLSTFSALLDIKNGRETQREFAIKGLKLLDFYIAVKPEEKLNSLKELIKIS
ncbi:MAG: DNA repair protein RecO [Clostridia bacterium]|nr:DNA repair protein RecO [Clostridia bacterium]